MKKSATKFSRSGLGGGEGGWGLRLWHKSFVSLFTCLCVGYLLIHSIFCFFSRCLSFRILMKRSRASGRRRKEEFVMRRNNFMEAVPEESKEGTGTTFLSCLWPGFVAVKSFLGTFCGFFYAFAPQMGWPSPPSGGGDYWFKDGWGEFVFGISIVYLISLAFVLGDGEIFIKANFLVRPRHTVSFLGEYNNMLVILSQMLTFVCLLFFIPINFLMLYIFLSYLFSPFWLWFWGMGLKLKKLGLLIIWFFIIFMFYSVFVHLFLYQFLFLVGVF